MNLMINIVDQRKCVMASTLMEITALCRLLTLTLFFPTVVSDRKSLSSPPCSFLFFLFSSSSSPRKRLMGFATDDDPVSGLVRVGLIERWSGVHAIYDSLCFPKIINLFILLWYIVFNFKLPCVPFLFSFSLCSQLLGSVLVD